MERTLDLEFEVCRRLREFRDQQLKIPRTTFALTIGISTERIVSYENGRAPIRIEVWKKVYEAFHLNPIWLVLGTGPQILDGQLDVDEFTKDYSDKDFVSKLIIPRYVTKESQSQLYLNIALTNLEGNLEKILDLCEDAKVSSGKITKSLSEVRDGLETLLIEAKKFR